MVGKDDSIFVEDSLIKEFYQAYILENNPPDKNEIWKTLRSFAVFSLGCSRLGDDIGQRLWKDRVDLYVALMRRLGYKDSRGYRGRRDTSIFDILESVFKTLRVE